MDPVAQLINIPQLRILQAFQEQLLNLMEDMTRTLPGENDLAAVHFFFKSAPIEDIMKHFVVNILPLRKYVDTRDDRFFINQTDIFGELQKNKVDHFKRLWTSGHLSDQDRQVVWKYFDVFIKLADRFRQLM